MENIRPGRMARKTPLEKKRGAALQTSSSQPGVPFAMPLDRGRHA